MKLLHLTFQYQYTDQIERIFDDLDVHDYVRYPRVAGRDSDGKHDNSQTFPGNMTAVHAQLPEEKIDSLFEKLRAFRDEKSAHAHLRAVLLPIERMLGDQVDTSKKTNE